jgi:hypothetical protein
MECPTMNPFLTFLLAAEEFHLESLTTWSPYLVVSIAACAVGMVIWLHARASKDRPSQLWVALTLLRIGIVSLLAFMALGWTWTRSQTEPPDLIVLLDRSASMKLADVVPGEGSVAQERFRAARDRLVRPGDGWLERWNQRFNLRFFLVDADATEIQDPSAAKASEWSPVGMESRLGDIVSSLLQRQRGRATAAIVLFSDGAITDGTSWDAAGRTAAERQVPLFLLGIGNDLPRRDLEVRDLLADDASYLGDLVVVDVVLTSRGKGTEPFKLELRDGASGNLVDSQVVEPDPNNRPQIVRLTHRPTSKGTIDYVVTADAWGDETNLENNRKTTRVEIVDRRLNVLWVESRPTFEFRFAKNLLERKLNRRETAGSDAPESPGFRCVLLEADQEYAAADETVLSKFPEKWEELAAYDLIVLGDVSPAQLGANSMKHIERFVSEQGRSLLLAAGPRFNPTAFSDTPLRALLPFRDREMGEPVSAPASQADQAFRATPTVAGTALAALSLSDSASESRRIWFEELEPLWWAADVGPTKPGVRTLLEKHALTANEKPTTKSDSDTTPLATLQFVGAGKVYFQAFDESYRWRKSDPLAYERYWLQIVRFLCRSRLTSDRPLTLTASQPQVRRGEPVLLRARFGDEASAPADDLLPVRIEPSDGEAIRTSLRRTEMSRRGLFEGNVTGLKPGSYHAVVSLGSTPESEASCEFEVLTPQTELDRPEMASEALRRAAEISSGEFARWSESDEMLEKLPSGKGARIASLPPIPLWNSPWLAALVVGLWATDWLLRRRAGWL